MVTITYVARGISYHASGHVMILRCRDGACMPGLVVPPEGGYMIPNPTCICPPRRCSVHTPRTRCVIKMVGGCKTLENIHGQRADQSPKESGMCNKDKRETLWRLWGCEVNLNIFIRPSGGSYNTRSEMHALYTTFTLFFVASYVTNPCLRAFSNISLVTPAIKRSLVA